MIPFEVLFYHEMKLIAVPYAKISKSFFLKTATKTALKLRRKISFQHKESCLQCFWK